MSTEWNQSSCGFCGRPSTGDTCASCARSLESPELGYFGVQLGDGSFADRWFQRSCTVSSALIDAAHATAIPEGVFNVEGGYVGVSNKPFALCDCNYTHSVREVCRECGRGPTNLVTALAGLGDGVNPVWSLRNSGGQFSGAIASVAPWLTPDYETGWSSLLAGVSQAKPLVLGVLPDSNSLQFADASPDFIVVLDNVPTDDYVVVAWISNVENPFFGNTNGIGSTQAQGLRPIAIGAYSGALGEDLLRTAPAHGDSELHHIIADLWGNAFQTHASHIHRMSMSAMNTFNAEAPITDQASGSTRSDAYSAMADYLNGYESAGIESMLDGLDAHQRALLAFLLVKHGMVQQGVELFDHEVSLGNQEALRLKIAQLGIQAKFEPALAMWESIEWNRFDLKLRELALLVVQSAIGQGIARALADEDSEEALRLYELGRQAGCDWGQDFEADLQSLVGHRAQAFNRQSLDVLPSLLDNGDTEGALFLLQVEAEQGNGLACAVLGSLLIELDRCEEALTWWNRGVQQGHGLCMRNLAFYLRDIGQWSEAERLLRQGTAIGDVGCMDVLAQHLNTVGQRTEAEALFERVVQATGDDEHVVNSTNTYAHSYLIPEGRFSEAQALLERAAGLKVPGYSTNATSNLGIVYFELGDFSRARQLFQAVLDAGDGPDDEARDYLARIATQPVKPSASVATMRFCPSCGTERGENFKFCANCGVAF